MGSSAQLDTALANLNSNLAKKRSSKKDIPPVADMGMVQMPIWPEEHRGLPSGFARTALFTANKDGSRKMLNNFKVPGMAGISIVYMGEELRQDDLSVVMALVHLARGSSLSNAIRTTTYTLLKTLGWSINSREYDHLRECLTRIKANEIKLDMEGGSKFFAGSIIQRYAGSLLGTSAVDAVGAGENYDLLIWLEPSFARLFVGTSHTRVNWEQRKRLGGKSALALWLHTFLSSHEKPYAISVAKYYELSGSKSSNMSEFRSRLEKAMNKLIEVGFLESWVYKENNVIQVNVRRNLSLLSSH
jgi:hypothetical protein